MVVCSIAKAESVSAPRKYKKIKRKGKETETVSAYLKVGPLLRIYTMGCRYNSALWDCQRLNLVEGEQVFSPLKCQGNRIDN